MSEIWHEARQVLHGLEDLRSWFQTETWLTDPAYTARYLASVRALGLEDPCLGWALPRDIEIAGENYRETITFGGHNARIRGVLDEILNVLTRAGRPLDVYAPERLTPLAATLSSRPPVTFTGSEYLPTPEARALNPGVRHEDVTALTFADASFDLYVTCEVLEHVPDVHAKLREARRVLRPGGCVVGTFPFYYGQEESVVKAALREGRLVHFQEPEYHGNPADPEKGSLVFTIPGWEILDWSREAGFSTAYFVGRASRRYGIRSAELAAVLIFVAEV